MNARPLFPLIALTPGLVGWVHLTGPTATADPTVVHHEVAETATAEPAAWVTIDVKDRVAVGCNLWVIDSLDPNEGPSWLTAALDLKDDGCVQVRTDLLDGSESFSVCPDAVPTAASILPLATDTDRMVLAAWAGHFADADFCASTDLDEVAVQLLADRAAQ